MIAGCPALTDPQWQVIADLFDCRRRRRVSLRQVFDGLRYIVRSGCQWRCLPDSYPPWQTVAYYFYQWQRRGLIQQASLRLNRLDRQREGRQAEPSLLSVDSQSVPAGPRVKEERGLDAAKKVNGRKRHILVDISGRIWAVLVTSASAHDGVSALRLIPLLPLSRLILILGDAAYGGAFRAAAEAAGIRVEIASRPPSEKGFVPIKKRWVVERTFAWTRFYRKLIHDSAYSTTSHEAWVMMINICLCLNRLTNSS